MLIFLDRLAANNGLTILLCSIAVALLCALICFSVVRGKMPAKQILSYICKAVVAVAVAFVAGFLVSKLPMGEAWGEVAFFALLAAVAAISAFVYTSGLFGAKRRSTASSLRSSAAKVAAIRHAKGWLFGSCVAVVIFAAMALAFGRPYYLLMFPVALIVVVLLLHSVLRWRLWYALLAVSIALFAVMATIDYVVEVQMSALPIVSGALAAAVMGVSACVTLTIRND